MSDQLLLGIDLGGTNFKMGVVTSGGKIIDSHVSKVGRRRDPESIVKLLAEHVNNYKRDYDGIVSVGIGVPGIVGTKEGIVYKSPNYLEWVDVKFRRMFSDAFGLPVFMDNDANMVAEGESWIGAGRDFDNFIMITLGTGIGGGIVCDNEVWRGDQGFAGEIGHILIDFNGPKCNCGNNGCWEMYASKVGLKSLITRSDDPAKKEIIDRAGDIEGVSPALIYEMAKDGNIFASTMWKKFGAYFGAGLVTLVNTTGIMNIVVGGGIRRAWDFFIPEARKEFSKRSYKKTAELVNIVRAELSDDAGIYGSAISSLRHLKI